MNPPDSSHSSKSQTSRLGSLGEDLVADWLKSHGWVILDQRWICRLGELDVVARSPQTLAFVEVKTRSKGNWDSDGLLAMTPSKQAKLGRAAQQFLLEHPELESLPCRFDVALVSCRRLPKKRAQSDTGSPFSVTDQLSSRTIAGYQLTLHSYIQEAFTV